MSAGTCTGGMTLSATSRIEGVDDLGSKVIVTGSPKILPGDVFHSSWLLPSSVHVQPEDVFPSARTNFV